MPIDASVQKITDETIHYAPAAVAAILAIENAAKPLPGRSKREVAIQAIQASSRVAQGVPSPPVAGIGALVDLFVTIFNATGLFSKTPAAQKM
jgi:hypothetical protein